MKATSITLIALSIFIHSQKLPAQIIWNQQLSLPVFLEASFSFTLNNFAYIGTGNQTATGLTKSFWQYDAVNDVWTQKADFGGTARKNASATSANGFGFAGLGFDILGNTKSDWWQYNATGNIWTQKSDLPSTGREGATCFAIGTEIYVVSGKNSGTYYNSVFEYNTTTDNWFPPLPQSMPSRWKAFSFVLNNSAYVGGGFNASGFKNDFWKFNSATNLWTQKASFPSARMAAVAGVFFGNGIAGSGLDSSNHYFDDFYLYDTLSNSWLPLPQLPGPNRCNAIGFTIYPNFYIACGTDSSNTLLNDLWKLDFGQGFEEIQNKPFTISPSVFENTIQITCNSLSSKSLVSIFDLNGKIILKQEIKGSTEINCSHLKKGIYLVLFSNETFAYSQKTVKL